MGINVKDLCKKPAIIRGKEVICGRPLNATGGCTYDYRHIKKEKKS